MPHRELITLLGAALTELVMARADQPDMPTIRHVSCVVHEETIQ
jgi:hypothetical protein